MTRFYLAARYGRREELVDYAADLVQRGHAVTSRWLAGGHQAEALDAGGAGDPGRWPLDEAVRFAQEDIDDLLRADAVVSFTEEPRATSSRGGRHVEFGMALERRLSGEDRLLVIVGPRENVFHCLPEVEVFPDWPAFLVWLDTGGMRRAGDVARTVLEHLSTTSEGLAP